MVNLMINNVLVQADENSTIMKAAEDNGISIPHLCYLKDINEIGACRLCSVEVAGEEKLVPSCITKVREGMKVTTNSARVREACRTNLSLIMSQHDGRCSVCARSGNCKLETLAYDFNIMENPYEDDLPKGKLLKWNKEFPLFRDASRCIKCMRCVQVCDKVQSMKVWDLMGTGSRTRVDVADGRKIEDTDCTLCGQCIINCPTGALLVREDIGKVIDVLEDKEILTVVQIAPAVRSAWGESLGLPPGEASVRRLAGVLRAIGFDHVFDTAFSADLTIMEEASELLMRLGDGEPKEYPMFTSCCPGWVRFVRSRYPELSPNLSTAKSPQQMFGAMIKSFYAMELRKDPKKMCTISIMPCVAKKAECELPQMVSDKGLRDVDIVLTTRELIRLMRYKNVMLDEIRESSFDSLMEHASGAGIIFGVTGGVMEASLRTAFYLATGSNPDLKSFSKLRSAEAGNEPWREAEYDIGGRTIRVAVASGLRNVDLLCRAIIRKEVRFDFVEMMACPNGCSGGGGQPIHQDDTDLRYWRGEQLHMLDRKTPFRFCHENPDITRLYREYLEKPLSENARQLLHVTYE